MSTFLLDTFTDVDGTGLTAHTGEVGATWVGHPNFSLGTGLSIQSNAVICPFDGATAVDYATAVPNNPHYSVTATIQVNRDPAGFPSWTDYQSIVARLDTSATTWYALVWHNDAGQILELQSVVAGVAVQIGVVSPGWVNGSTHTITLSVTLTRIVALVDGAVVISGTDSLIASAGKAGLWESVSPTSGQNSILDIKAVDNGMTPNIIGLNAGFASLSGGML